MRIFAFNSFYTFIVKTLFMKQILKTFIDKSIVISLIFICFSIFLPPFFKSLSLTILILLIILTYSTKSHSLKENVYFDNSLLLLFFYLLHIVGVLYSTDKNEAFFDLQVKLPLLLFPLVFMFIPKNILNKKYVWIAFVSIIIGLLVFIIFRFGFGINFAIQNKLPIFPQISYVNLTGQPSYFALIAAISLIITYKAPLVKLFNLKPFINYILKYTAFLIITIFFLFLNSTSGIFLITMAYVYIITDALFVEKNKSFAIISLLFIIAFYTLVFNLDTFNNRYKYYANVELKAEKNTGSQRKFVDLNAHKIILQSSVFGTGTGDVKSTLNKFYIDNDADFGKYYNAHNQFLQTTIALGLVGLIILILVFLIPMIIMIKQKEYFLFMIFCLIGFSFLFESMLEKSMGTFFFGLIYVLSNSYLKKTL